MGFDTEHSGTIDARELKAALRALGFEVKKEDVRRMLSDVGKEPSQPIDFNDFCEMMRGRMPDKNSRAEIDKVFALFDEDEIRSMIGTAMTIDRSCFASKNWELAGRARTQ